MNRMQEQVREFHRIIEAPTSPAEPMLRNPELRARLILEEALETVTALIGSADTVEMLKIALRRSKEAHEYDPDEPNLIEALDGICDTIVVCCGTAEDIGVDLEPFFDEVHRTNMQKANGPVRADGKRGKPPGWMPPDIAGVLSRARGAR